MSLEKLFDMPKFQIFEILCNIIYFQAAVYAISGLSQFYPLKKKLGIGIEYSKIRNFVTYQIIFLMTCQQH